MIEFIVGGVIGWFAYKYKGKLGKYKDKLGL